MNLFSDLGVASIPHFAPLHYLPFIARSRKLMSKERLRENGFSERHFRTKSKNTDVARGFGGYVFLTLSQDPRIVQAKLKGGFPHIAVQVPESAFEEIQFDLCRYNVAMARRTTDSPTGGFPESATNGRYYCGKKLPIAREDADKVGLLAMHYPRGTMIEVLVRGHLHLPNETKIHCYCEDDSHLAEQILAACGVPWHVILVHPPGPYHRKAAHVAEVRQFLDKALADPDWKGSGLEFDRV